MAASSNLDERTLHEVYLPASFFKTNPDPTKQVWAAEPGIYEILVGASSQDIRLNGQFKLQSELTSKP